MGTSQDWDQVVETYAAAAALLCAFVLVLQLQLLVLVKDAPLLVEELVEIGTTSFSHANLSLFNVIYLFKIQNRLLKVSFIAILLLENQ